MSIRPIKNRYWINNLIYARYVALPHMDRRNKLPGCLIAAGSPAKGSPHALRLLSLSSPKAFQSSGSVGLIFLRQAHTSNAALIWPARKRNSSKGSSGNHAQGSAAKPIHPRGCGNSEHNLRHTFASLLIQNGESLAYVKEQLGHSSIKMTVDIYGHLVPGANRQAVNRLPSFKQQDLRQDIVQRLG